MLKDLIKSTPTEIEAEYLEGFFVTLQYVGLPELERVMEHKKRRVLKGGKLEDEFKLNDTLRQAMSRAIKGWRGLTKAVLLKMNLDLDPAGLEAVPDGQEIPCDHDNKQVLLENDAEFWRWVQNLATDIIEMRARQVTEEAENLPKSHGGMPDPDA